MRWFAANSMWLTALLSQYFTPNKRAVKDMKLVTKVWKSPTSATLPKVPSLSEDSMVPVTGRAKQALKMWKKDLTTYDSVCTFECWAWAEVRKAPGWDFRTLQSMGWQIVPALTILTTWTWLTWLRVSFVQEQWLNDLWANEMYDSYDVKWKRS